MLSKRICELRISFGWTQVQLAQKLGVTKQTVSNWENDNVIPSIEMLVKIADAFNVKTDLLLGRDSEEFIDVSDLTEEQRGHIALLVEDFARLNKAL